MAVTPAVPPDQPHQCTNNNGNLLTPDTGNTCIRRLVFVYQHRHCKFYRYQVIAFQSNPFSLPVLPTAEHARRLPRPEPIHCSDSRLLRTTIRPAATEHLPSSPDSGNRQGRSYLPTAGTDPTAADVRRLRPSSLTAGISYPCKPVLIHKLGFLRLHRLVAIASLCVQSGGLPGVMGFMLGVVRSRIQGHVLMVC